MGDYLRNFADMVNDKQPKSINAFFMYDEVWKLTTQDLKNKQVFSWFALNIWNWKTSDIAEHFKVTERTAQRWVKQGQEVVKERLKDG